MSKRKSLQTARLAGAARANVLGSGCSEKFRDFEAEISFMRHATSCNTSEEVVDSFSKILRSFDTEPEVLNKVAARTGLDRELAAKILARLKGRYKSEWELKMLLLFEGRRSLG